MLLAAVLLQNTSLAASQDASGDVSCQIDYTITYADNGLNSEIQNIDLAFHITKKA